MVSGDEVPKVGSLVRLEVETWNGPSTLRGVMLSPSEPGCLTVKMVSGYNATHTLESVKKIVVTGVMEGEEAEGEVAGGDPTLPLVHILHTGGTIASKVDYATGAVTARFEPHELVAAVPALSSVARIEAKKLGNMWSDDIRSQHWNRMAEAAAESFSEGAAGVVITHGTDTMHISAAALSFAFGGGGGRPAGRIVFTGSQRSSDRGSTDGAENLIAAVHWAAWGPEPTGRGDSSVVVMHAGGDDGVMAVHSGVAVRKNHSSTRAAFESVSQPPLSMVRVDEMGAQIEATREAATPASSSPRDITVEPMLYDESKKILQLIAGPHLQADQIGLAKSGDYDAILFWGTGLGHLPLDDQGDAPENLAVRDALSGFIESGGVAVVSTQCIHGPVHLDVYSKGRTQKSLGMIGHGSVFPPEVALVKLHFLLTHAPDALAEKWAENIVGENPTTI